MIVMCMSVIMCDVWGDWWTWNQDSVGGVAASYSAKMTDNSIVNDQKFITCATDKKRGNHQIKY